MPYGIEGVPAGVILAALEMIENDGETWPETLLDTWGPSQLAEGFAILICGAMQPVTPAPGEGDCLHLVVPAVVARLRDSGRAGWSLPTMAAVLTAAALGEDLWQWRAIFGSVGREELAAWRETARLIADMADNLVYGEEGTFARIVAEMVTDGEGPE